MQELQHKKENNLLTIDEQKCTSCGLCVAVCVRRILHLGEGSVQITDPAMCIYCGHCKAVCPTDAPRFSEGNEEFTSVPSKEEIPVPFLFCASCAIGEA